MQWRGAWYHIRKNLIIHNLLTQPSHHPPQILQKTHPHAPFLDPKHSHYDGLDILLKVIVRKFFGNEQDQIKYFCPPAAEFEGLEHFGEDFVVLESGWVFLDWGFELSDVNEDPYNKGDRMGDRGMREGEGGTYSRKISRSWSPFMDIFSKDSEHRIKSVEKNPPALDPISRNCDTESLNFGDGLSNRL
jgi:hypothetical protein